MTLTFLTKEAYLAGQMHEVKSRIRHTLAFPAMMQPAIFEAIITDIDQALRNVGYEEAPQAEQSEGE